MAQSEGSATSGREARHIGKTEHGGLAQESTPDILCTGSMLF